MGAETVFVLWSHNNITHVGKIEAVWSTEDGAERDMHRLQRLFGDRMTYYIDRQPVRRKVRGARK